MYEIFEQLCQEKGVTAYKVCKETGITTATISNWKAGRYTPKQEKMQKKLLNILMMKAYK